MWINLEKGNLLLLAFKLSFQEHRREFICSLIHRAGDGASSGGLARVPSVVTSLPQLDVLPWTVTLSQGTEKDVAECFACVLVSMCSHFLAVFGW